MKLYSTKGAPNPERVILFMKEKGRLGDLEVIEINLMKGEHRAEGYKAVNSLMRVPTLVLDDGTTLGESRAICTYLESVYPEPNLMGETSLERAQIEMWDRRVELNLLMAIAGWFRHGHPSGAALEPVQCKQWSELSGEATQNAADYFDDVLGQTEFVAGSRFTNADISLFIGLNFARYMRCDLTEGRANMARWKADMAKRPLAG